MGEKLSNERTDKEREMYEYIVKYMEENLISPSFQEICKGVNTQNQSHVWGTIFSVLHTDCCYYQSDRNDLF